VEDTFTREYNGLMVAVHLDQEVIAIAHDWRTPEDYMRIFAGGSYESGVQDAREAAAAVVYR
jgi:hypothetical protein